MVGQLQTNAALHGLEAIEGVVLVKYFAIYAPLFLVLAKS